MQHYFYSKFALTFNFVWLFAVPVQAQIIPDSSLKNNPSVVVPNQVVKGIPSDVITGGAARETTLFHSFQEFNIDAGRGAYFSNADGITNILSRVTGINPSFIAGKLGVLGNANLFIFNPNGIVFGPNASLDLNASFLASTASSVKLSDGREFSATNPQSEPLLTVSVPIGLGFTGNSGPVQVQGVGHTLSTLEGNSFITVGSGNSTTGLRIQPKNTIALIGGNVEFDGGVVSAPSGRIEVGSVGAGQVRIKHNMQGFTLDYSAAQNLQNIHLAKLSLLDVSGTGGGDISLLGRQVRLSDGSFALSENQGFQPAGRITVKATELLEMIGTTQNFVFKSPQPITHTRAGLLTQTLYGSGADILISTQDLNLISGGGITTASLLSGDGGNISIDALGKIQVQAFSPLDPINSFSIIASVSLGSGKAGDVDISSHSLSIKDGGSVSSGTFGRGDSGKVTVNATESINLDGVNPFSLFQSLLSSATYGSGSAEDLVIHTRKLTIMNGARADSSTYASGDAGSVKINALEQVEAKGSAPVAVVPPSLVSSITSSATVVESSVQELLRLPSKPSGNAGDVTITTQKLLVDNGAQVAVQNDGTGNAGTLRINANSINLDNQGGITADTASGEGGNIFLDTENLQLRHNSPITATARGGTGSGGNIIINADTLVALEDSDISADAFGGPGGTIRINAQGIFGTAPRSKDTPESDITASSGDPGVDGTIEINTLDFDARNTLTSLTSNFISTEQVVAGSCLARRNTQQGSFVVTGSGGLPTTPYSGITEWDTLTGVQSQTRSNLSEARSQPTSSQLSFQGVQKNYPPSWKPGDPIIEAQGFIKLPNGRTVLGMKPQQAATANPETLICSATSPES